MAPAQNIVFLATTVMRRKAYNTLPSLDLPTSTAEVQLRGYFPILISRSPLGKSLSKFNRSNSPSGKSLSCSISLAVVRFSCVEALVKVRVGPDADHVTSGQRKRCETHDAK